MKRTAFLTRILSLLGTAVACTLSQQEVAASQIHEDVTIVTYTDFGQNMGRFVVGDGVNALLQHIRTTEGGTVIHYTDGTPSYTMPNSQGMISFRASDDIAVSAALGPNMVATVAHNGELETSFAERVVGSAHAINYTAIGYRDGNPEFRLVTPNGSGGTFDYMLQRKSKVFTDTLWVPVVNVEDPTSLVGQYYYRSGSGEMSRRSEVDGRVWMAWAYAYTIGCMQTIDSVGESTGDTGTANNITIAAWPGYGDGVGASMENPIPSGTAGGDSGSPLYYYDTATKQYVYLGAHQAGYGDNGGAVARIDPEWTNETLKRFDVTPSLSSGTVYLNAITNSGTYYADAAGRSTVTQHGYATDAAGNILARYNGVHSGLNTWADFSPIKDTQNWYAYDSNAYLQQSVEDLFYSSNLVFNAEQAENTIVLNDSVDLGVGYVEFNAGESEKASFTIISATGESNIFNHAGYVINEGAEVHLQLTNPEGHMSEWRKAGAGDLYLEGMGNNNTLLTLGGSGTTYLQQQGGYAAYNVLASSGATVVISDLNQIARDMTMGAYGGTLDMQGYSMEWYLHNTDVAAEGFSINALTEEAFITNTKAGTTTTLTFKESGAQTFLGSFTDTEDAALKVDYQGNGIWKLHSIHTKLSHADSGLSVSNGHVIFSGTLTQHAIGSESGTNRNRLVRENDWHYADATMDVSVASGAVFELGSHARLTGDVTVADGGLFILRESVHNRYEYVEGGDLLEDTYKYEDFYGLHGDVSLAGDMLVEYSEGTTTNSTLIGNLSGAGTLTIKAGTTGGTLTMAGDNSELSGVREIISGGVIATTNAGLGQVGDSQWLIGKQGWLASHGFTQETVQSILSYIDQSSTGTLALSNDLTTQLNLAEHQGLFIGAEAGKTVQYGAADTADSLIAYDGKWNLGGGGGELVVNFKLTGDHELVLGADGSSSGTVTLANSGNTFSGAITFVGAGMSLAGYLGSATMTLPYGNALLASFASDVEHLTAESDGMFMLHNLSMANIDLTAHVGLAVGASVNTVFSGTLTVAEGEAYRVGVKEGATLTLSSALAEGHDMIVDAQGGSGGKLVMAGNAVFGGDVTVQGNRDSAAAGDITLAFGRDTQLTGNVTLNNGGVLDVAGYTVTMTGNVVGNSGVVTNSTWTGSLLDTQWQGELVLHAAEGEDNTVATQLIVPQIRKTGMGNVTLAATNTYTHLYLDAGSLTLGHASAANVYGTILMSGDTTLNLNGHSLAKSTYCTQDSIIMSAGAGTANVVLNGTGTGTIGGNIQLGSGAQLNLVGNGIFALNLNQYGSHGSVLEVQAPQLTLNSSGAVNFNGTLRFTNAATLYSNGTGAGMNRNINRLETQQGLTLTERSGTNYWNIGQLSGSGSLQWNAGTVHADGSNSTASRLVLSDEGDFAGHIVLNRTGANASHTHGAYIELAHDKAAQNADITLTGKASGWASLAINTANAITKGLIGNEYAFTFAGAAGNTLLSGNSHPATTRKSILTLNTDADTTYTYAGTFGNSADTLAKGLDIVKLGAGTQNFTGTAYVGHVTAQQGRLAFSGTTSVAGNVAVGYGATLSGIDFQLASGKTFTVAAGDTTGTAVFDGNLTFGPGTLIFDASGIPTVEAGGVALTLSDLSFDGSQSSYAIQFTHTGALTAGSYTLATGDWTNTYTMLTAAGIAAYDTSFSTNASGHLVLNLAPKAGSVVWDAAAWSDYWSTTRFGQSETALGSESIAVFDDTAGYTWVDVQENITVASASFLNSTKDYTINSYGGTATVGSIVKYGAGTVTINSGLNVATGGTTIIHGGELVLKSQDTELGTVSGDGTLVINWSDTTPDTISIADLETLYIKTGSFGAGNDSALGVRNIIIGAGARYVQGSAVNYTGNITSEGGMLDVYAGSLNGTLTLTGDTSLYLSASRFYLNSLIQQNGHKLTQTALGPNLKLYISTHSEAILSNYVVEKGVLVFEGSRQHTGHGTITLQNGTTLQLQHQAALEAEHIVMEDGSVLHLQNGSGNNTFLTTNLSLAGTGTKTIYGSYNGNAARINGTISGSGTLNLTTTNGEGNAYAINSVISDGADAQLAITVNGATVTMSGANTYSGGTTLTTGAVTTNNTTALGSGLVTLNGGSLILNKNLHLAGLAGTGGTVNTNGKILVLTNTDTATYAGTVSGQGCIMQTGSGSSSFTGTVDALAVGAMGGSLSFTGTSTIADGGLVATGASLTLGGSVTLGDFIDNAGTVTIADATVFNVDFSNFTNGVYTLISGDKGSIVYNDTDFGVANFNLGSTSWETLSSMGVQYTITQTGTELSLTLLGIDRDLTWTGSVDANWDSATANWTNATGETAAFMYLDNVCFGAEATNQSVTVADSMEIADMTVSGGAYSFSGGALHVHGDFTVASGAVATLNTMPTTLGNAAKVEGTLALGFTGTWTQDIDASAGTVAVNNSLTWNPASGTITAGTLQVKAGTFETSSAMEVGTLELAASAGAKLTNNAATDGTAKKIDKLVLGASSILSLHDGEAPTVFTTLGEVQMAGGQATITDVNHSSYIHVDKLSVAEGVSASELVFRKASQSSYASVYELGSATAEAGNFVGTITLQNAVTDNSTTRPAAIILSGADVAREAVINLGAGGISNARLGLGINADTVTIAGLKSVDDGTGSRVVFSGTISSKSAWPDSFSESERTLIIHAAGDYSFGGEVKKGVNLVKQGSGTQAFTGTVESTAVTAQGGTLDLNGATLGTGALGSITMHRGSTLKLSSVSLGVDASLFVTGSNTADTSTLSGSLTLGGGTFTFDAVALDSATAALTVGGGISLADGTTTQTITLKDDVYLASGQRYWLLGGSFDAGITADSFTLAASGASSGTLTLESNGLWLTVDAANYHIWAGNESDHTWSASTYGVVSSSVLTSTSPATFDDTASAHNVVLSGAVESAGGVVFDNTVDYTLALGNINSTLITPSIELKNTGSVAIHTALDADTVTLAKGTLKLRDYAVINADVTVSLSDGATLDIGGTEQTLSHLTMADGTQIADDHGAGTLHLVAAENNTLALSGVINVGTIATTGTVSLTTGAATHTLVLNDTALTLNNDLILGSGSTLSVGNNAVLNAAITMVGCTLEFDGSQLAADSAALDLSGSTLALSADTVVNVVLENASALKAGGTWQLATGDWSAFTADSFTMSGVYDELATFSISGNTLSLTMDAHGVWAGTNAQYNWNTTTFGPDDALASTAMAIFDDTAANKNVSLSESVSVGSLRFLNTHAYTITGAEGATLSTTGSLVKQNNGSVRIDSALFIGGDVSVSVGSLIFGGQTTVSGSTTQSDGTVTIAGANSQFGDYTLNGGTLNVTGTGASLGHLTARSSTYFQSESATVSNLTLNAGIVLQFLKPTGATSSVYHIHNDANNASLRFSSNGSKVYVEEGVVLNIDSIANPWGWNTFEIDGSVKVLTETNLSSGTTNAFTGKGSLTTGSLRLGNAGTYVFDLPDITVENHLNIQQRGQLKSGIMTSATKTTQTAGTFSVQGGILNLAGNAAFTSGTLTLASGKIDVTGGTTTISNTFNMNGGTLMLSGGITTISNSNVSADGGAIVMDGGSLKLASTAAQSLLSGVDSLTLTSGTLDLSDLSFSESADNAVTLKDGACFSFGADADIALGDLSAGITYQIFNIGSDSTLEGWAALNAGNFSLNGMDMSKLGRAQVTLGDTGTFSYTSEARDLIWTGSVGSEWNQSDANWVYGESATASEFANGDSVTFASDATVSVPDAVYTPSLTVDEGVRVILSGESVTATSSLVMNAGSALLGSIHIGSAAALTLHGSAELGDLYLDNGGNMTLSPEQGVSYTIGSLGNVSTLTVQGKGILNLGDASLSNLDFSIHSSGNTSQIGEINVQGSVEVSEMLSIGWGTVTIDGADASLAAKKFRGSTYGKGAYSVLNINGGSLTITGEHDGSSQGENDIIFMLAHWNNASTTINLNAGSLASEKAVMYMGWDSSGIFRALGGKASLLGVQFSTVKTEDADRFELGSATSGTAVVSIGSAGITGMSASDVVQLGHGTLKAAESFSITGNSPVSLVATASETLPGTILDTNGNTITVATAVSGSGAMVKRGKGTLAFTAASTGYTGSVAVEDGTLKVDATSATLLEGASALTLTGGMLDLSFIDSSDAALTLAQGAAFTFTDGGVIALGALQEDVSYTIFDVATHGATLTGWNADNLSAANFTLGGNTLAEGTTLVLNASAGTFMYTTSGTVQYWDGGESGVWDTVAANWDRAGNGQAGDNKVFFNDLDAVFASSATGVTVAEAISVNHLTVKSGVQLPLGVTEGGSLTVNGSLVLEEGSLLSATLPIALNGTLSMAENSTWNLTAGSQSLTEAQLSSVTAEGATLNVLDGATLIMTNKTTAKGGVSTALNHVAGDGTVVLNYAIEDYDNGIGFDFSGLTGTVQVDSGRVFISSSIFNTTDGAVQPTFKLTSGNSQLVFNGTGTELKSNVELAADTTIHVNSKKSATISGVISGSGNLTQAGAGTLTFAAQNTYSGTTSIAGVLVLDLGTTTDDTGATVNSTYTLSDSVSGGTLKVASGTTLRNNDKQISSALVLDGGNANVNGDRKLTGNVTVNNGSILTTLNNDVLQYSGSHTLTVAEGGEVDFASTRQTMGGWTLELTGGEITGAGAAYGSVYVAAIDYHSGTTHAVNATSGESEISATTGMRTGTLAYSVSEDAKLTVSGAVQGSGAVSKSGAGELVFTTDHSYTGSTTISAGTLTLAAANYSSDGTVELNGGELVQQSGSTVISHTFTLSGGTLSVEGGSLALSGTATATAGRISVSGGTLVLNETSATLLEGINSLSLTGGELDLSFISSSEDALTLSAGAQFNFADGTIALGALQENETHTIFDVATNAATLIGWNTETLSASDFTVNGLRLEAVDTVVLDAAAGTFSYSVVHDQYWDAAGGSWNTTDANWDSAADGDAADNVAFINGRNAIFASSVSNLEVEEAVSVADLTVKSGVYVPLSAAEGGSLEVTGNMVLESDAQLRTSTPISLTGTLSIAEGADWFLDGATQSLTSTQLSGVQGTMQVLKGSTLSISDTVSSFAGQKISGEGTVEVTMTNANWNGVIQLGTTTDGINSFTGKTVVKGGKFTLNGSTYGSVLHLNDGASGIQLTGAATVDAALEFDGNIEVYQNGGVKLTMNGTVTGAGTWDRRAHGELHFNQAVSLGGFRQTAKDGAANYFNGTTTIGTLTQSNSTTTFNGATTITTANLTGGTVKFGNGGTTITTANVTAGTVTLADSATYNAETAAASTISTLAVSGGTLNISATGLQMTTTNLTGGAVNVTGTNVDMGALTIKSGAAATFAGTGITFTSIDMKNDASSLTFNLAEGAQTTTYTVEGNIGIVDPNNDAFNRNLTVADKVTLNAVTMKNGWGMDSLTVHGALNLSDTFEFSTGNSDTSKNIITGDGSITASTVKFGNVGTYNVSIHDLTATSSLIFESSSTTNMTGGTLTSLKETRQTSGTVKVNGGTLKLGGTANFTGGTLTLADGVLEITGGTTSITNTLSATGGEVLLSGGELELNATTAVALLGGGATAVTLSGGTLDLSAVGFSTSADNAIDLTATANVSISSGRIELGNLVAGNTYYIFDLTAENASIAAWTGWGNNVTVGGVAVNRMADATLELTDDAAMLKITDATAANFSDMYWVGGEKGVWDYTSANWDRTPANADDDHITFIDGDGVIFAAGTADVTATQHLAPVSITLESGANVTLTAAEGFTLTSLSSADDATITMKGGAYTFSGTSIGSADSAGTVNFGGTQLTLSSTQNVTLYGEFNFLADTTLNLSQNTTWDAGPRIYGDMTVGEGVELAIKGTNGLMKIMAGGSLVLESGASVKRYDSKSAHIYGSLATVENAEHAASFTVTNDLWLFESGSIDVAANSSLNVAVQDKNYKISSEYIGGSAGNSSFRINLDENSTLNMSASGLSLKNNAGVQAKAGSQMIVDCNMELHNTAFVTLEGANTLLHVKGALTTNGTNTAVILTDGAELRVEANSSVGTLTLSGQGGEVASTSSAAALTANAMTLAGGSTLTVDTTTLTVTDGVTQNEGSRVLGTTTATATTTIIPTNGGVLDDRGSLYAVSGTLNIGDDDTANQGGTVYVKGLALTGDSVLNVKADNTFVITGTTNTASGSATTSGKNYGDFQITTSDATTKATVINVEGTLTANSRFSVAGGKGTFNVKSGGTVNMLDGTAEGGASTSITYNVEGGGRVNIASYESNRTLDGDNDVTLKLSDGATVGGIADSSRGEDIYMLQKVEIGGTATIDTDAATYDATTFEVTETDNGTDMVFTRAITTKDGSADAVLKVAGHGTAHLANTATLSGGLEVEQGAGLAVSAASVQSNPTASTYSDIATITSADGENAATVNGAVSISHAEGAATIAGTDADNAATVNNSLITIAQGASLTVDHMIISESSRITGQTAATFAARTAGVAALTATNTTVKLGEGNAEVADAPTTLAQGKLVSLDGNATKVWMAGDFSKLTVTSDALSSLTLNAGSSLNIDFSSLLENVEIDNIDLIELSFADVNVDWTENITITGVLGNRQMVAYYLAPTETAVANVGNSIYFATDSIPEPTTTTLSLLALAALAARRRRR